MSDKFTAVDFPKQHPPQDVADHEVLMSFNGDLDAVLFLEWWHASGAEAFGVWRERRPMVDAFEGQTEPCCECGEGYPRRDLMIDGEVFCPKCREEEKKRRQLCRR